MKRSDMIEIIRNRLPWMNTTFTNEVFKVLSLVLMVCTNQNGKQICKPKIIPCKKQNCKVKFYDKNQLKKTRQNKQVKVYWI